MERSIRWTKAAIRQFQIAIEYIRQDSLQNAEKVRIVILSKIDTLKNENRVHRQDPLKRNNDGSFFYFEIVSYRIVFRVIENEVFIIRIRHTSREPLSYLSNYLLLLIQICLFHW